jgi:hypothetical protein
MPMKKSLTIAALVFFVGATAAFIMPTKANASMIGLQLCDNGQNCATSAPAQYADLNVWTPYAGDQDRYDPDYIRIWIGNTPIPADTDIRIGIQALDDPSCWVVAHCSDGGGRAKYTSWASEGGGWSDWATDVDGWDPDLYRMIIETRPLAGKSVTGFNLEAQESNSQPSGNNVWGLPNNSWDTAGCGYYYYPAGSDVTPLSSAGGGWTAGKNGGWAGMEYNGGFLPDPNCARVKLTATVEVDKPVTTLRLYKNGAITLTPGNKATVGANDTISIGWNGNNNNATGCEKNLASPVDFVVSGVQGTSAVAGPTPGSSAAYAVRCQNAAGWGDPDTLTITRTTGVPAIPSGLSASCNAAGNQVTLSWAPTSGATGYYPRVSPFSGACPATLPSKSSTTCYTDNYSGTSITASITPGQLYSWWVHSGNVEGTSDPAGSSFICGVCSVTINNVPTNLTNGQTTGSVYTASSVPYGSSCPAPATYTCNSGVMSGGSGVYYTTCAPEVPVQQDIILKANNSASSTISVRAGSTVTLTYDGKNSSSCTLSGVGGFTSAPTLPYTFTSSGSMSGSASVTVNQKSIFNLSCSLVGSSMTKSVTVNMLPTVIEI